MTPVKIYRLSHWFVLACCLLITLARAKSDSATGSILPQALKCEWRVNPLGIDSAHPHFSWTLRTAQDGLRGTRQLAYRVIAATSIEAVERGQANAWDSGKVSSSQIFQIAYGGIALSPATRYFWKVRVWDENDRPSAWSNTAEFTTGLLNERQWQAKWIAAEQDGPLPPQAKRQRGRVEKGMKPLPVFRREFSSRKDLTRAIVFISGLGQYELRINGNNVTDHLLTPGWTNYRKRVFYDTYDVTQWLQSGQNAIAVWLGNGMYNVPGIEGRYTKFIGSFGQPKLIFQMHLRYRDGSEQILVSDKSWKTTPGPIIFSTIYGGEDYDARRELSGWELPNFSDKAWAFSVEVSGPGGKLAAEQAPPIRAMYSYVPVKVTHPQADIAVYDLGQNFSGWPVLRVRGSRGARVKLLPGELLDANGLVTQRSTEGSPKSTSSFTYTLRGSAEETWQPKFTYHGFRYVQVETAASEERPHEKPAVLSLSGSFIHDDVAAVGQFETSDRLLGQIHRLINMAILSNMVSVLTDCPHREKLGWLEETHLAGPSILLNYDAILLYRKMAQDIRDSQLANGMVPSTAPEYVQSVDETDADTAFRDSPEWGSAVILSPWTAYQFYGDKDLLAGQYNAMRAYAEYLAGKTSNHLLAYGLGDWFDIGPGEPGESKLTSMEVTASGIYYQDLITLSKTAALLGKAEDAEKYAHQAAILKNAFNSKLFHAETGQYDRGSQTANAMPLALGLVPDGQKDRVLQNLIADIRRHGNHVTAGDIGFHYVVRALTDAGRSDVLYDMLSRTDSPSYGYQLSRGATTLTEAWDTNPDLSQNHFMLGHAEEWFYRGLAGIIIDFDRPEEERITIRPQPVGGIEQASAHYQSVLGEIRSEWQHRQQKFILKIAVPAGAIATVEVPTAAPESIRESGKSLERARGILSQHKTERGVALVVSAGEYEFISEL
jgi:hypothetical protein